MNSGILWKEIWDEIKGSWDSEMFSVSFMQKHNLTPEQYVQIMSEFEKEVESMIDLQIKFEKALEKMKRRVKGGKR